MGEDTDQSKDQGVGEVVSLVYEYVKQETIDPLRGIIRYLGFGVAASFFFGIGALLMLLATLRALQNETGSTFTGSWSWAPYLLTVLAALCIAVLAVSAIGSVKRKTRRKRARA